jgi:uncharacterized protein YabE (DUF348 family)
LLGNLLPSPRYPRSPRGDNELNGRPLPSWNRLFNLVTALAQPLYMSGVALTVGVLLVVGQAVTDYVAQMKSATVIVDGISRRVRTQCSTVDQVLDDLGVSVQEMDWVDPGRDVPVTAGMTITVQHARPVQVVVDGAVRAVYTHGSSADDILREAGVELGLGDKVVVDGAKAGDGFSEVPVSRVEVRRAATIHLVDSSGVRGGGLVHTLYTTAATLEEALRAAQVLLYEGDRVYPALSTPVSSGMQVHILRAVPVLVEVDGRTWRTRTLYGTVGEVLGELRISLLGQDYSEPSLDTAVRNDLRIRVVRVSERTLVEQTEVPYETLWVPDHELELDRRHLDDVGAKGITRRRYKVTYHDGQEVDRYLEAEWMAQEPRPRRVVYGTRIVVRTVDTPHGPIEYWRRIRVFRTAYTAATCGKEPDHPLYGITRLGWKMRHGIIAVDPRVIRLRSSLYVPGYGPGIAGDTGGLIKGRHIDLGYEQDGLVWHYEWGYVYLLTPVPPPSSISYILPDYPRER